MDLSELPCKNCITLPVCRLENKRLDTMLWISLRTFYKCSLIREYSRKCKASDAHEITKFITGDYI